MAWKIDKTFEFCYGHRVWTQTLNADFSDDLKCACRHLHGHEAKVQVFMESETLNPQSMVTDFRHLEFLKKWLNANVDHQFVIDKSDPLRDHLTIGNELVPLMMYDEQAGWSVQQRTKSGGAFGEMLEGILVVDFVPTSERLSEWLFNLVAPRMATIGVKVTQVDWWETPKSRSTYTNPIKQGNHHD